VERVTRALHSDSKTPAKAMRLAVDDNLATLPHPPLAEADENDENDSVFGGGKRKSSDGLLAPTSSTAAKKFKAAPFGDLTHATNGDSSNGP